MARALIVAVPWTPAGATLSDPRTMWPRWRWAMTIARAAEPASGDRSVAGIVGRDGVLVVVLVVGVVVVIVIVIGTVIVGVDEVVVDVEEVEVEVVVDVVSPGASTVIVPVMNEC